MIKGLLISLAVLVSISISAQSGQAIEDLREGVLVVRLTSDYKKIKELNRLIDEGNISGYAKGTAEDRIRKIQFEREAENELWIRAFDEFYQFSEILFAYDTLGRKALALDGKNCFLNPNLEIDPSLSLNGRPFLMLYFSNINSETGSGAEAVIFRNSDFEELSKPFPYYVKTTNFMFIFNKLFKPSISKPKNIGRVVKKLNRNLERFYEKRG